MSGSLLYLSANASADEKVAKLDSETFVRRLQDLTEAIQSLNQLKSLMKHKAKPKNS